MMSRIAPRVAADELGLRRRRKLEVHAAHGACDAVEGDVRLGDHRLEAVVGELVLAERAREVPTVVLTPLELDHERSGQRGLLEDHRARPGDQVPTAPTLDRQRRSVSSRPSSNRVRSRESRSEAVAREHRLVHADGAVCIDQLSAPRAASHSRREVRERLGDLREIDPVAPGIRARALGEDDLDLTDDVRDDQRQVADQVVRVGGADVEGLRVDLLRRSRERGGDRRATCPRRGRADARPCRRSAGARHPS